MSAGKPLGWRKAFVLLFVALCCVAFVVLLLAVLVLAYVQLGLIWTLLLVLVIGTGLTLFVNRVILPRLARQRQLTAESVDDAASSADGVQPKSESVSK